MSEFGKRLQVLNNLVYQLNDVDLGKYVGWLVSHWLSVVDVGKGYSKFVRLLIAVDKELGKYLERHSDVMGPVELIRLNFLRDEVIKGIGALAGTSKNHYRPRKTKKKTKAAAVQSRSPERNEPNPN